MFTYSFFSKKKLIIFYSVLILSISLIFNFFSVKNILFGLYKWHSTQPETTQGGLELILVFILIYLLLLLNIGKLKHFIIIFVVLYLQLHHVILPAAASLLYLEILVSTGFFVRNKLSRKISKIKLGAYLEAFIIGFFTWAVLAIFLSLLGHGGFTELRVLTLILGLVSLYKKNSNLLSVYIYNKALISDKWTKLTFTFSAIMILTQFAKTNRAIDYDSVWYGLRPEQVLIGQHSFFDNLNLVMAVHYYPKLFELFTIPLGNLNDYSFIPSVNIMLYTMLLIVIYLFSKYLSNNKFATLAVILLASTPALANMASTAKPDIFSALFICVSAFYFWSWVVNRKLSCFTLALSCAFISMGGKVTSLMYIPLLLFGIFLVFLLIGIKKKEWELFKEFDEKKLSTYYLTTSVFIFCLICYRTIKLTGYPFFPVMRDLWEILGFKGKYPFLEAADGFILNGNDNLYLLWKNIILNPRDLSHYVMVWPSNAYIYIWLLSLAIIVCFFKNRRLNLTPLLAFFPLLASSIYYISTLPQGGDGNYYLPVIILTVVCFMMLINQLSNNLKKTIFISLILFIPIQTSIMMVSHFSWSWGTAVFSLNITKSNFDTDEYKRGIFQKAGINAVADYLSENATANNCIGISRVDGEEQMLNQLPCRQEDIQHMASRFGSPPLFESEKTFEEYLKWAKVDTIIFPKERHDEFDVLSKVISKLKGISTTEYIEDDKFELLRFIPLK